MELAARKTEQLGVGTPMLNSYEFDNETILHKFPPIRWEPAACPNCGAHIKGLRYRGREAEIDWQELEHRELSAGFKEWKYEK